MLGPQWFFRMKRWVQHPPSPRRVAIVLAVVAICLGLFALERAGWLPGWMAAERMGRPGAAIRF